MIGWGLTANLRVIVRRLPVIQLFPIPVGMGPDATSLIFHIDDKKIEGRDMR